MPQVHARFATRTGVGFLLLAVTWAVLAYKESPRNAQVIGGVIVYGDKDDVSNLTSQHNDSPSNSSAVSLVRGSPSTNTTTSGRIASSVAYP